MRAAALGAAIMATLAVAASDARAATAEVEFLPGAPVIGLGSAEHLRVRDDAGEANAFTVSEEETTSTLVIADARAPLAAGDGCEQIDRQRVRCFLRLGELASIGFDAGAFDDVVDLRGLTRFERAFADSGSADDLLRSGSSGGTLIGGPGQDALIGGGGPDTFIDSAAAEHDSFAGGGGDDRVAYFTRTEDLSVDLAAGVGGAAGEGDRFDSVEDVTGGEGVDVLRGDDGSNYLSGGDGDDLLDGRGGDDSLDGGPELPPPHDVLIGGAGDDLLRAAPTGSADMYGGSGDDSLTGGARADRLHAGAGADGLSGGGGRDLYEANAGDDELTIGRRGANRAAKIACGAGGDLIVSLSARERPPRDCERMLVRRLGSGAAVVVAARGVRVGRRRARVRLSCTRRAPRRVCRGTIVLRRVAGRSVVRAGARSYRIARGRSARILVPVSRAALRTLRTRRSLELRVSVWYGTQFGIQWTVAPGATRDGRPVQD